MPARSEHLQQARENVAHAEMLLREHRNDPPAMQWAVTAAFYCGMHCIEAFLADRNIHCSTHQQRRLLIRDPQSHIPDDVYTRYRYLEDWSIQSRYRMRRFEPDIVERTALGLFLREVTGFVGL